MADNFNLRTFLSENKLTKNAKLLKEQEEDGWKTFDDSGMEGLYMGTVDGVKIYSVTDSSVNDYCAYVLEYLDGSTDILDLDVSGQPISPEELQEYDILSDKPEIADFISRDIDKELGQEGGGEMDETSHSMKNKMNEGVSLNGKPVDIGSIEIDGIDTSDYPDFVDAYIVAADYEDGTPLTEDELMSLEDENYGIVGELIFDRQLYLEGEEEGNKKSEEDLSDDDFIVFPLDVRKSVNPNDPNAGRWREKLKKDTVSELREASYKTSANSKEAQHLKKGDIIGSGDEVVSVSAGAKTPSGKVEVTLKTKSGKTKVSTWGKSTKVGVKAKETVKENTMTNRERRLVEMVNNAMEKDHDINNAEKVVGPDGITRYIKPDDLTAAERMYNSDQYVDALTSAGLDEGEDMVEEKPLPKYENIEKLMQEIDKSTDEAAHKYKMEEMKRVADGLEKKATALEEGDNAEHIDQKKLKQMKKDIMSLRKGIEKMEKLGEKRFTKKETKESKPAESLAEGFFDLRKFLVENKLTAGSKLIKEAITKDSPSFKKLVSKVQQISDESGNDWDKLKEYLKGRYAYFETYTTGTNPAAYVVNFFSITKGKDKYVEKNPSDYIQIGDWYIRPW